MLSIESQASSWCENKRQKFDKHGMPSCIQTIVESIENVQQPGNLIHTLTLPLTAAEQSRLWKAVTTTWRNLKHKHVPADDSKDEDTTNLVSAKKENRSGNNLPPYDEAEAEAGEMDEEITMDDWEDVPAEEDPMYCAQKRDAQTIVDWANQVARVAPIMPLSQLLSAADDAILGDRFCLMRVALKEIMVNEKCFVPTPQLLSEAEHVWRDVLTQWDADDSITCITELIDIGLFSWFDEKSSRFDPLYYIASTRCILTKDVAVIDKRKLVVLARERLIDSGYYLIGCKIFGMATTYTRLELDALFNHHKGCWPHIFDMTFSDRRTIWTVVQRVEDFECLLQIALRTSRRIKWGQLMSIDSLHGSVEIRPRLGIALHFCRNENVLKCILEEMTSSCLDEPILDAPNLPSYIAQHVCPFLMQRVTTRPELLARTILWVETYVESHLSPDARLSFGALQFTPPQQEQIDKLRHFIKHADSCLVCLEDTLDRTICNHAIHVATCMIKLESAICPGCRVPLAVGADVKEEHLEQLRKHVETSKAQRLESWQNDMIRLQELYNDMLPPDVLHELAVRHNV